MPTLLLVGMMTTIHALQAFDAIYLLTQGGPNRATTVLAYALYETAFQRFEIGQATALGFIIFTIIAVLTLMQWKLTQRKQATWDKV
jgi:ABC-type sugar transport system permease subunit